MRVLSLILALATFCPGTLPLPLQARQQTAPAVTLRSWDNLVFRIEDSKCRVGIASVKLSVSALKPQGGYLIGEYSIVIPLKQSKNDTGRIILPLDQTVSQLGATGGTLRGHAISHKSGTSPNPITCQILPKNDQTILLAITTEDRTIHFESRYSVSGAVAKPGAASRSGPTSESGS